MRVSTPLAAGRQQARVVAPSEAAPRLARLQPSSSSSSAIDLALARVRRPSLTATSAVPPAKATTTTTTASSEASTSNAQHSPSSSSSAHKAANSTTTTTSGPISLDQLPRPLRDSVVVLSAPNPRAPGGQTPVYVLGVSHVSKRSLDRVRIDDDFSLTFDDDDGACSLFCFILIFSQPDPHPFPDEKKHPLSFPPDLRAHGPRQARGRRP